MTLQAEIDALPKYLRNEGGIVPCDWNHSAALARLALARKWISESGHAFWCEMDPTCTCGRDALLEALEVPRD